MTSISGIYEIRNIENGKRYIGSTVSMSRRWVLHKVLLKLNKHHSQHLQNSYNKYGKDCFVFEVIEECDRHLLMEREQYYIDIMKPEYNMSPTATSVLGLKHTAEARAHMSAAQIGNTHNRGRKHTDEARRNMSLSQIGNKKNLGRIFTKEDREKISSSTKGKNLGRKFTQEHKDKISNALKGNKNSKKCNP